MLGCFIAHYSSMAKNSLTPNVYSASAGEPCFPAFREDLAILSLGSLCWTERAVTGWAGVVGNVDSPGGAGTRSAGKDSKAFHYLRVKHCSGEVPSYYLNIKREVHLFHEMFF